MDYFFLYKLKIQSLEIYQIYQIILSHILHFLYLGATKNLKPLNKVRTNWEETWGQNNRYQKEKFLQKKNNRTGTQPKLLFHQMSDTTLRYRTLTFSQKCWSALLCQSTICVCVYLSSINRRLCKFRVYSVVKSD